VFSETGCICKAKGAGRGRGTEAEMIEIRVAFVSSPKRSTSQISLKEWRLLAVQKFNESNCSKRVAFVSSPKRSTSHIALKLRM
jgi:hypothetical protein